MKLSILPALSLSLCSVFSAAACAITDEEPLPPAVESAIEQNVGRGWFELSIPGIGVVSRNAAGVSMELRVDYDAQGRGYAYPYAQRTDYRTSWIRGITWANCSNGSQPTIDFTWVLNNSSIHTSVRNPPKCPAGTRLDSAFFFLFVDN